MKTTILVVLVFLSFTLRAQHCPWDCTGLLLVKTDLPPGRLYPLEPILVDENKEIIVSSVYGTSLPTFDTSYLLYYDDFAEFRKRKSQLEGWYSYDTVYYFAEDHYIIKFSLCKYGNQKLYLRFHDPVYPPLIFHYIEIPVSKRVSPHDFSNLIYDSETKKILETIRENIIHIDCGTWRLPEKECK